jgi:hypothetical protein
MRMPTSCCRVHREPSAGGSDSRQRDSKPTGCEGSSARAIAGARFIGFRGSFSTMLGLFCCMRWFSWVAVVDPRASLRSTSTRLLRRHQSSPQHVQIGKREHGVKTRRVLRQAPVAHLGEAPQVLYHVEDVFRASPGSRSDAVDSPLGAAELLAKRGVIGIWKETGPYRLKRKSSAESTPIEVHITAHRRPVVMIY